MERPRRPTSHQHIGNGIAGSIRRTVTALGAPLEPPWRKDEKEATLLAWAVLAAQA
jgi:hypothetical protein